jgi:YfiH family protein
VPDWPAPANVRALQTLRSGGCSPAPWNSFNLGDHVGDDPATSRQPGRVAPIAAGRAPVAVQVHGNATVDAEKVAKIEYGRCFIFARQPGVVCVVMTADCLPVLFCDRAGTVVAAAHAGWRGLVGGVLEATIASMAVPADQLLAWLGPAIGPQCFEVGDEVRAAFIADDAGAASPVLAKLPGKWLADIYGLARRRLQRAGVAAIYGGGFCTVSDPDRFFSYRRDGVTGRQASLIWLANHGV